MLSVAGVLAGALGSYLVQAKLAKAARDAADKVRQDEWDRQDAKDGQALHEREKAERLRRLDEQNLRDRDDLLNALNAVHRATSASHSYIWKTSHGEHEPTELDRQAWLDAQREVTTAGVVARAIDEPVAKAIAHFAEALRAENPSTASLIEARKWVERAVVSALKAQRAHRSILDII